MYDYCFISHTAKGGTFAVGSHHLSDALAKRGARVAHVSTPISAAHLMLGGVRSDKRELVRNSPSVDDAGVLNVVPFSVLPTQVDPLCLSTRRAVRRSGIQSTRYLLVDQPLLSHVARKACTSDYLIYRPTDLYLSGVARRRQQEFVKHADGVIATSEQVLESLGPDAKKIPNTILTNGVDFGSFAKADSGERRRGIVYVGALDGRFDWNALNEIAQLCAPQRVDVYGPLSGMRLPKLAENIELKGAVQYQRLPELLSGYRIGLLPLSDSPLNAGRSPMKLYEYIASGLAVVARDTPSLRALGLDCVALYNSTLDLQRCLDTADGVSRMGPDIIRNVARSQSWDSKADLLERFCIEMVEQKSRRWVQTTDNRH